jgi:hypothetical protein
MSKLVSLVIWLRLRGSGAVIQSRNSRCCRRCSAVMPAGMLHTCGHGSDALKAKLDSRVHLQRAVYAGLCMSASGGTIRGGCRMYDTGGVGDAAV